MASNCPGCGAPAPDEARFCMRCGRERPPVEDAAPPAAAEPGAASGTAPAVDSAAVPAADLAVDSVADTATDSAADTATDSAAERRDEAESKAPPGSAAPAHPATLVDPPAAEPSPAPPPAPAAAPAPAPPPPEAAPATPAYAAPLAAPPPPGHLPPPPKPSPVGAFLGRALRGDWAGSVRAALWPLALLLVTAVAWALPSYGQDGEDGENVVGFVGRLRLALAVTLQAVGGDLELSGREERSFTGSTTESAIDGSMSIHLVPLTVTALFVGALFIGARTLRNRLRDRAAAYGDQHAGPTAGLEAALRVGLVTAVGVLALGLFAQPEIEGVEVSSGPFLAMLGALLLALAVTGGLLYREGAPHQGATALWPAGRPGAQAFLRAAGVALRALAVVLVVASAVGYLALTQIDELADAADTDDAGVSPYVVALLVLPNLGLAALGVGWGAPLEAEATGRRTTSYGGERESQSFGFSELGDLFNSGAVVGALALGLVCALTIGVLAARRCAGRGEQVLAAGLFFGMFLLLAAVGGFNVETSASEVGFGGSGNSAKATVEGGVSLPEALLFGLLWVAGAVVVGPFVARTAGQGGGVGGPPMPPGPPGPSGPPGPAGSFRPAGSSAPSAPSVPSGMSAPSAPSVPSGTSVPSASSALSGSGGAPGPGPGQAPVPDAHAVPTQSALPVPPPPPHGAGHDPYPPAPAFQLGHPQAPRRAPGGARGRAGIWVATLVGALVVGGGVAAGVLLWQQSGDDTDAKGKNGSPSVSSSEQPSDAPSSDDASTAGAAQPTPAGSPSDTGSTDGGTGGGTEDGVNDGTDDGTDEGADAEVDDGSADSAGGAAVPSGSQRVTDTMGFSFAVPDGWSREIGDNPTQIVYAGVTGPENFQIGVIDNADYTSYGNLRNMEVHAKKDPDKSDYRRIRLADTTFRGRPAAVWEYTYEDRAGRTIHAIDHSYIAGNGTEYALQLSWREDFWPAGHGAETHRTALNTWRLIG
ncbi:zinc ribbon domain-containing protein [Streptomyces typhae]|uniref:zinc ribbon domain-containing protein n=1 Tax=Streptomyces typhae TaxID=2681492 RepID=UPI0018DFFB7C|nr:zinc ribbon domain-containing protein [Streptomyces typhae]